MADADASTHPCVVTSMLPDSFGYTKDFISGALKWDFDAEDGGGRQSIECVKKLMAELASLTRQGKSLQARQDLLRKMFSQHYDGPRVDFILKLLCSDAAIGGAKLSKAQAIDVLVERNAPFIPFDCLSAHLKRGLKRYQGKRLAVPPIDWTASSAEFLQTAPFNSERSPSSSEDDSEKMVKALSHWQDAIVIHNKDAPKKDKLFLSDHEIEKLSGSQFSVSERGTPTFRTKHFPSSSSEKELREKLVFLSASFKRNAENNKQLERQAAALRSSSSVISSKRKADSDDEDNAEQGMHALDIFLKTLRRKIHEAAYIDFSTMSADRLKEIKMLNSSSSKTTKIATGLVFKHVLSEADVATLSEDLTHIQDGFFYLYLKLISESLLLNPMAIMIDRIGWWQWMSRTFKNNPAAQVKFIKAFVLEHHEDPFWLPLVKHETDLVMQVKEECPIFKRPAPRDAKIPPPPNYPQSAGGRPKPVVKQQRPAAFSPVQKKKIEDWKKKFPNTCLSRMIGGKVCGMELRGLPCKFSHACAWCGSASCLATCPGAKKL